ncbi:MAG TPA: glycosyl hydrolase family 18 protein, partial [Pseudonocardiaceae bacterium]
ANATTAAAATLPTHVFAPYFEAFNGNSLSGLASQSGNKFMTMAFLQTASTGSCTVDWNGDTTMPVGSTFASDINTIRASGGDVIPSFGGFAADDTATEIADSCTNVASIAQQYENVITTYNVTRLDLDTEDKSLTNNAGIDRRNKAIKMVEDWAAGNGRTVQFVYTLPTTTSGLASSGLAVLQNAVQNNARVDIANIMTFDYFDNASHEMANDTMTAANGLVSQLQQLYPGKTTAQLWAMVGITEMPGIDDFGAAETFTTADATTVENWAVSKGIGSLSFWAVQRDNGGCVGTAGSNTCSGIAQSTWQFSHTFQPFTRGGGQPPPPTTTTTAPPTTTTTTPPPPPNGLANGGFETGLSPWTAQPGTVVVGSPAHSGSHALSVNATNSQTGEADQTITVTPNASHTLTAWVQGNFAFIGVTGGASASTWTSSAGYTKLTVPFTTGSSGTITVFVHGWFAQGTVFADDVSVS